MADCSELQIFAKHQEWDSKSAETTSRGGSPPSRHQLSILRMNQIQPRFSFVPKTWANQPAAELFIDFKKALDSRNAAPAHRNRTRLKDSLTILEEQDHERTTRPEVTDFFAQPEREGSDTRVSLLKQGLPSKKTTRNNSAVVPSCNSTLAPTSQECFDTEWRCRSSLACHSLSLPKRPVRVSSECLATSTGVAHESIVMLPIRRSFECGLMRRTRRPLLNASFMDFYAESTVLAGK
jgi:hypothetical protein